MPLALRKLFPSSRCATNRISERGLTAGTVERPGLSRKPPASRFFGRGSGASAAAYHARGDREARDQTQRQAARRAGGLSRGRTTTAIAHLGRGGRGGVHLRLGG